MLFCEFCCCLKFCFLDIWFRPGVQLNRFHIFNQLMDSQILVMVVLMTRTAKLCFEGSRHQLRTMFADFKSYVCRKRYHSYLCGKLKDMKIQYLQSDVSIVSSVNYADLHFHTGFIISNRFI